MVKPRSRLVVGMAHMPLANKGGGITGLLQILGKVYDVRGLQAVVIDHAMLVRIKPC